MAGNNNTGDNFSPVSGTPVNSLSPVSMTPAIKPKLRKSLRIFVTIQNGHTGILRGLGELILIHEKI
jgi:hypothetical protein